jgi:redox-sensitive bicupin YhaK (pirin superfamily)
MSWISTPEPTCSNLSTPEHASSVEKIIESRPRDLGGFSVKRVLPAIEQRLVGPFIFFDEMGPADFAPGAGIDVRPHPHINLATVTYLFEGEITHRDSLGSHRSILPGAINWMTAGRGIVHSERTGPEQRARGGRMHGIQLWVALPQAYEEVEPEFFHHPEDTLPERVLATGVSLKILAGSAYGATSPVKTYSPLFYVVAHMPVGSVLTLPEEHEERAAYIVNGTVCAGTERAETPRMFVFSPGGKADLRAETPALVLLLGGAPLDGVRHMFWNFVSSSQERIERAKADWRSGRFPRVPGDEEEFIPLPE